MAIPELKPEQRIRVTQTVRVGQQQWPAVVIGTVREVQILVTGLKIQRGRDDVVTIPTIHFTKDNGELSSVAVDENTRVEVLDTNIHAEPRP